MQLAILTYDRFTSLDAIGPYEILSRLPDAEAVFVGIRRGEVRGDSNGLRVVAGAALDEVTAPDIVLVPGGPGQEDQMADGPVHEWLREVDKTSTWTTSVCTGSLILAAAGLLSGRRASTHWLATEQLTEHGALPSGQRVTFDGKYVTAAGVSAGIDMGLTLAGQLADDTYAQVLQLATEYDPQPPYTAGQPDTAPTEVVELLRANADSVLRAG